MTIATPTSLSSHAGTAPGSTHPAPASGHAGNASRPGVPVRVWDLVVRFGHWMLVVCFLTAWFTEGKPMWLHSSAGYGIAIVLGFRLMWGFIGTPHARFRDFLYSPREALDYLKSLLARRPRHYLGHNPAGAMMIFALLFALAGTAGSGMALYDADRGKGPVASARVWLADTAPAPGTRHRRDKQAAHFWEETHELFANLTLALIALHIAGVAVSSAQHHENLVRAMITGRKMPD